MNLAYLSAWKSSQAIPVSLLQNYPLSPAKMG